MLRDATLYNIRSRVREKMLTGRSPLAALLDAMMEGNTQYFANGEAEAKILYMFVVSPAAQEICETLIRGSLWLLNATSKTNGYNKLLLHIFSPHLLERP